MAGHSKMIRDQLAVRYVKKINKTIEIKDVFVINGNYFFWLVIPSEKNHLYPDPVFYDILIEFYPITAAHDSAPKIDKYGMKVFSNCPTFIFNFTYVYNKMKSLFRLLPLDHYSEYALKDPPDIMNPYKILGIEKSIFYAITKLRLDTGLDKKKIEKMISKVQHDKSFKLTSKYFAERVSTQILKLREVQDANKNKLSERKHKGIGTLSVNAGGKDVATAGFTGKSGKRTGALVSDMKKTHLNTQKLQEHKLKTDSMRTNNLKSKGFEVNNEGG